ncbi:Cytochrome P450 [Hibiscus syriacus]|uniref:Cytochrome P450 n=1 Tax=Hibiscus syriacus TaxID=106335 RepID=A0A6A2X9D0_HIBSY|nr:Cytochrome P450 [Hibiscus syriacus]
MAVEVMKTHNLDFCSRPNLRGPRKLSYEALDLAFSPYIEYWKEMRKICVVHLFSGVHSIVPSEKTKFLGWYEEEGAERSRFHGMLKESEAMFTGFSFSDYFPSRGWADRFTGFHTRLEKAFKEHVALYQELIDEHLDPNRPKPDQEDIVDVLLRIRKDRDFPFDLIMDHIKAVLMDVFIVGTDTVAVTVAIGRDPETWENPEVFCPERFIGNSIDYKGRDFELIPFGAGRRICPGIFMGVAEMEPALANLLYKFDWEMPNEMSKEDIDFATVPGLAVHKKNALLLAAYSSM